MAETFVLLGLGANLGDPPAQLAAAVRALGRAVRVDSVSSLFRTAPVGFSGQPDFYNLVAAGRTVLAPAALLGAMREIEAEMGRVRGFPNGPRVMDIDLLAYGGEVIRTPELVVPHPGIPARGFVLYPLAEIAPEWRHPELGATAVELLRRAGPLERVERLGPLPDAP